MPKIKAKRLRVRTSADEPWEDVPAAAIKGEDGKSAYELWLSQGNSGTLEDFFKDIGGGKTELPTITEADEGRVLTASGGVAVWRDLPKYTGEYTVTPEVDTAQTLETAGTYMTNDVTVNAIPDYEVSNEAGGNTFIIGKEII